MELNILFKKIITYQSWWSILIMEVETSDWYVDVTTMHWIGPRELYSI